MNDTQIELFWSKVAKTETCWNWIGSKDRDGYGRFTARPNVYRDAAHRVAHRLLRGDIPDGLQIDHLCRNRSCVNPDHLEVVPGWVNNIRGESPSALNARKNACPKGHNYDGTNSRGDRVCKRCIYENNKRAKAARRALAIPTPTA